MRFFSVSLLLGASGLLAAGTSAWAETANSRTAAMPFEECLSIIAEVSQEIGEDPIELVRTGDLVTARIDASDGFVTVSCSRPDSRMTLAKSPVPAAAGMTAAR